MPAFDREFFKDIGEFAKRIGESYAKLPFGESAFAGDLHMVIGLRDGTSYDVDMVTFMTHRHGNETTESPLLCAVGRRHQKPCLVWVPYDQIARVEIVDADKNQKAGFVAVDA